MWPNMPGVGGLAIQMFTVPPATASLEQLQLQFNAENKRVKQLFLLWYETMRVAIRYEA